MKSPPLGPKWGRWAKKLGCASNPPSRLQTGGSDAHQSFFVLVCTPAIQGHRVKGSIYCRARCADSKKVSYVGVGPSKVGQKRAKISLASAK